MRTWGDVYPRLRELPGYEEMADRPFDHGLRVPARHDDGPAAPPGALVVRGHADSSVGYGRMLAHVMKGLEAAGVPTVLSPIAVDRSRVPLDPFLESRLVDRAARPALRVSSPGEDCAGSAIFTMWESSDWPDWQVRAINTARVVVVPNRWNAETLARCGCTAPIRVVPLGVDTCAYFPGGSGPEGFVVLSVARMAHGGARKGVDELIDAFIEALGDRRGARLHLKLWPDCPVEVPRHPRVTIDRGSYDDAGMRRLYLSASVYASMTKGEGWGMPPHEAMTCGRAYVGPLHSGIAEFATPECSYPVEWAPEPGGGTHYAGHGDWLVPRHGSMVRALREAYADPEGRRRKGEAAARRAAEFTWGRTARELLAVLREFGLVAPVRPEVAAQLRLARLRGECPHASKAGCGCEDLVACSKAGRDMTRDECYECLGGMGNVTVCRDPPASSV